METGGVGEMKIEYRIVTLDDVMSHFAKGFTLPDGRVVWSIEHFIDPIKGKVVFRLTTFDAPSL